VPCDNDKCRFSPFHPRYCPSCPRTCLQYHQFPEQYNPHVNAFCPSCQALGYR
ncbi:hypothetical protein GYMLUDRAFT_181063, partial [Collybiopsis luxurians FD-317 M1]